RRRPRAHAGGARQFRQAARPPDQIIFRPTVDPRGCGVCRRDRADNSVVHTDRRNAFVALTAAGALWGLTIPFSKLALVWLDPFTLAVGRFALAAPLLAVAARGRLRPALSWRVA